MRQSARKKHRVNLYNPRHLNAIHQNMIPNAENSQTEFKTSFNDEVITSLVAFSNAKGGSVYIGLNDKAEAKGVDIGKETIQHWVNEIKNKTSPQIIPDSEVIDVEGKTVVIFSVPEYPIKPVSFKGRFYKRNGNANHMMLIDEIANEHLKTINTSWDYYIDPNHTPESISSDKVNRFIQKIKHRTQSEIPVTPLEFLSKMEMLREGKLTFGGYLLFVSAYCPISDVQIGRFKSDITIIDSLSLNTDLFTEVEEIISFIKKHLMVEYIITGEPQRTERFDYPLDAIREIVINMVVHRDYRDSSGSMIKIFDDRIEFFNPGNLYGGITIESLLTGNYSSKTRNKLIAKAFKEVGLIERYGSGIKRIIDICSNYKLKQPVFEEVFNGFRVVLFKEKTDVPKDGKDTLKDTLNDTVNDTVKLAISKNQKTILELITARNNITAEELADIVGINLRNIKLNISKLKAKGMIQRIGPDKSGHWQVLDK